MRGGFRAPLAGCTDRQDAGPPDVPRMLQPRHNSFDQWLGETVSFFSCTGVKEHLVLITSPSYWGTKRELWVEAETMQGEQN